MVRRIALSVLAAFGLFGLAEQAGAVAIGRMLASAEAAGSLQLSAVVRMIEPAPCAAASGGQSKASALLGGGGSALDRIRMDQAAQNSPALIAQGVPGAGLAPGAAPLAAVAAVSFAPGVECNAFALPRSGGVPFSPGRSAVPGGADDFLQTRRLAVSRTAFDQQWERVSEQGLSLQALRRETGLAGIAPGGATLDTVTRVNTWANRRIRFVEDAQQFGTADYWAPAPMTLRRGAGDCEDIAIAKLQALAALGVPRSDMFLTIARDLARHADHAVLVVRLEGRFWLLDNSTDRVLDAAESYDYQPVLSFSQGRKWLHGAVLASR